MLVLYGRATTYLGISGSTGAASGIILLKVWHFAAFVDVVLVSSNWIDLELKNSHSASSCSRRSRGQRLSFNLLPHTVGSAPHQGACADLNKIARGLVVDYVAPAPALYASPTPVVEYIAPAQVMSYAAPAQVLVYLALAPAACAAPFFTAIGAFGSLPVEPTVCTCTCGRLHCVNTSSVRGTCTCHGVHRVAPAVYVTSAPVVESTRRLQHIRCTCACRGVHHVSTISVLRRASTGTVYFVPAPVSYATYCDCNRWLRFSPSRAHRLHLHLWWNTSRRYHQ